eukprot:scaffold43228_cov71-Attheya_sp.AAC.1
MVHYRTRPSIILSNMASRCFNNFFKHEKVGTIHDRRQTRVLDNENAGTGGRFEHQGHSAMSTMQQYAKWQQLYSSMFSMWVPLVQIKTASIGDDSGGSWLNSYS